MDGGSQIPVGFGDDQNSRLVCDGDCYTKNVPHEHCYRCDFCERTADDMALSWTPLHGAVALGRKEMTELLLSYGADTSSKLRLFNGQWTPGIPCKHEVTALQLSRMKHPIRLADGPNRSQWENSGYQRPRQQDYRDVEDILMRGLDDINANIGIPVCTWRDQYVAGGTEQSCFGAGLRGVSLPELLLVFRDFPNRMDHPAKCPVRRFKIE